MTPEWKIQKKIVDFLEKQEWFTCIKQIKTSKNGIPDLLVLTGNSKHFWIEVKTEVWKLSVLQKFVIKGLRENWDYVIVPYGFDDFLKQYNEYKEQI